MLLSSLPSSIRPFVLLMFTFCSIQLWRANMQFTVSIHVKCPRPSTPLRRSRQATSQHRAMYSILFPYLMSPLLFSPLSLPLLLLLILFLLFHIPLPCALSFLCSLFSLPYSAKHLVFELVVLILINFILSLAVEVLTLKDLTKDQSRAYSVYMLVVWERATRRRESIERGLILLSTRRDIFSSSPTESACIDFNVAALKNLAKVSCPPLLSLPFSHLLYLGCARCWLVVLTSHDSGGWHAVKRWVLQDQLVMCVPPFFLSLFSLFYFYFLSLLNPSLLPLPSLCRGTTNSRTEVIVKLSSSSVHPSCDALCSSVHSGVISIHWVHDPPERTISKVSLANPPAYCSISHLLPSFFSLSLF